MESRGNRCLTGSSEPELRNEFEYRCAEYEYEYEYE
jgi:hypothetical protein